MTGTTSFNKGPAMTTSSAVSPSPDQFQASVSRDVLGAGSGTARQATISTPSDLSAAIDSSVLALGTQSGTESLSPLLADVQNGSSMQQAIGNLLLGGTDSSQTVGNLAALGATLNSMAKTAQSALASQSPSQRTQDLSTYQSLLSSLDDGTVLLDGTAGNATSLGLPQPGNWGDSNLAAGTQAIATDMTAVVKAYIALQHTVAAASASLLSSMELGA
jgi:hypothetical protein